MEDSMATARTGRFPDAAAEAGQVIVGGHVAVGVLDFDPAPLSPIALVLKTSQAISAEMGASSARR